VLESGGEHLEGPCIEIRRDYRPHLQALPTSISNDLLRSADDLS
jgi:hypothetical protein